MKSKLVTPIIIAVSIVVLIAWKLVDNKQTIDRNAQLSLAINTVVPVLVETPHQKALVEKISVNGRINSKTELTVHSKAAGMVVNKYKKVGNVVPRGTVIAQLENNVLLENLQRAALDFAKAEKDVQRFQNLLAIGACSLRELEESQIALRSIESKIAGLKEQLGNTTIIAPVAGIISKDYFETGTLLSIGSSVVDIVDISALSMHVNVTEKEILKLENDREVDIVTDLYPGKIFTGKIDAISPKSNDQYHYAVEIALNDSQLQPGMFATAIFNVGENRRNAPVVSREAIVGGLKDPNVFMVKDGKAHKVAVQVGVSDGEYIEIIDGISLNDTIVKSGQINLVDGTEVSILNL